MPTRSAQANLWTEFVTDEATAEYMLLPRLSALAERLWSPRAAADWLGFRRRAVRLSERLAAAGYRVRPIDADNTVFN
jgi:hexosaminidase